MHAVEVLDRCSHGRHCYLLIASGPVWQVTGESQKMVVWEQSLAHIQFFSLCLKLFVKAQKQNACIALYSYFTHYFVLTHLLIKQLSHEKHQGLSYVTVEERTGSLVAKEHPTVAINDILLKSSQYKRHVQLVLSDHLYSTSQSCIWHQSISGSCTPGGIFSISNEFSMSQNFFDFSFSFKLNSLLFQFGFPRRGTAGVSTQWSGTSQAGTVGGMGWCLSREMQVLQWENCWYNWSQVLWKHSRSQ